MMDDGAPAPDEAPVGFPHVPLPADELQRLTDLHGSGILDSPREHAFDELVALAARLLDTPIAAVNLIDGERQWTKAGVGLAHGDEAPRTAALCSHTIAAPGDLLVVNDLAGDMRFAANPFVDGGFRFYAGVALRSQRGYAVGTLCVIDTRPRDLTPDQFGTLRVLAAAVSAHLAIRRERQEAEGAWSRLQSVLTNAPDAVILMGRSGRITEWNTRATELFGWSREEAIGCSVAELIIPEEARAAHRAGLARFLQTGETGIIGRPVELVGVGRDGADVPVELTLATVGEGEEISFVAFARGLAARRAAECEREQERHGLAALAAITRRTSAADAEQALCRTALDVARADGAHLWRAHPVDGLVVAATAGAGLPVGSRLPSTDETGANVAFRAAEPLFVADVATDPRASALLRTQTRAGSVSLTPLLRDGQANGVLAVLWRTPREALAPSTADLLAVLAGEAAAVVERSALLARLEELTRTDDLTGIPNRRALDDALAGALASAQRTCRPLALVMLDLDRFKGFNDEHGHLGGDRLLKEATAAWRGLLRDEDVLARFGGDELALLLPDCSGGQAQALVERLREATPRGQTCSAGIAEWTGSEGADALLARADRALYSAKAAGRDRAVLASR